MTELHPDRLGAALSAVALIEKCIDNPADTEALMPVDELEALTMLSSAIWCARMLTLQLADELDATPTEVTQCLRGAILDAFTNPNPEQENN